MHRVLQYYTVSQKTRHYSRLLSIASPTIDRFSKFLHQRTQQEICNNMNIKKSTTPRMRPYTALWNIRIEKSI